MSKILSLGKTQYLGAMTDLRFADGVVFAAVSSFAAARFIFAAK
ncbi:MAG TPA: hypothetical protein PKY59_15545 [Pyrinomonadaceae bacterium]|nr:hypothetical protein [Pyrinomonadaceae bacterium]